MQHLFDPGPPKESRNCTLPNIHQNHYPELGCNDGAPSLALYLANVKIVHKDSCPQYVHAFIMAWNFLTL